MDKGLQQVVHVEPPAGVAARVEACLPAPGGRAEGPPGRLYQRSADRSQGGFRRVCIPWGPSIFNV